MKTLFGGRAAFRGAALALIALALASCAEPSRLGMVRDEQTGLQFGSVVERSITTDPSFYHNRKIKLRLRNTSGDPAFDMAGLAAQIKDAYRTAGYIPVEGDDFGLLLDVNVTYSGQVQRTLTTEYTFLGAAGGGLGGAHARGLPGAAAGAAAGATLGAILGSHISDDTYIVVSSVTFGVVREPPARDGRTVIFDRSLVGHPEDHADREMQRRQRGMREVARTQVAVFAGGRNVGQSRIAGAVRERLARVVSGLI